MQANPQPARDPGIAAIIALLLAARTRILADSRALADEFKQPMKTKADGVPDRSEPVKALMVQFEMLRTQVEGESVEGAAAIAARDITARALSKTENALGKLAESYSASDKASSLALMVESDRLMKESKAASVEASKALKIPWPLQ